MRTTFIVRNLTSDTIAALDTTAAHDLHDQLTRWASGDLRHCVSVKYGPADAFRDRVAWNGLVKARAPMTVSAIPRRGYRLYVFEAGDAP